MSAISIIARLTFREAIRRRIMLAGLVLGIAFVILFSIGTHFIFGDIANDTAANMPSQMAADILIAESTNTFMMMGLYAATFLSIAMAALLGADTLAGEITSGTIQTIATKPIRRVQPEVSERSDGISVQLQDTRYIGGTGPVLLRGTMDRA